MKASSCVIGASFFLFRGNKRGSCIISFYTTKIWCFCAGEVHRNLQKILWPMQRSGFRRIVKLNYGITLLTNEHIYLDLLFQSSFRFYEMIYSVKRVMNTSNYCSYDIQSILLFF